MLTKLKSTIRAAGHSFGGAVCAGAVLLIPIGAHAQNLFLSNYGSGDIFKFTPAGERSTIASQLSPAGLAFNREGNLFVSDSASGNIYEYTPDGVQSTFASGLYYPTFLAFKPMPRPRHSNNLRQP